MRRSVLTKLLATVGLLVALMVVVGVVGISGLSGMASKSRESFASGTQPIADLGVAKAAINESRALTNLHILDSDAKSKKAYEATIAKNSAELNKRLDAIEKTIVQEHPGTARERAQRLVRRVRRPQGQARLGHERRVQREL
jgi:hypothetical protein